MGSLIDYTGQKFGKLLIIERAPNSEGGKTRWICECECGQDGVVLCANEIAGGRNHCGCEFSAKAKNISRAHKRRMAASAERPVLKNADRIIDDFLYKNR